MKYIEELIYGSTFTKNNIIYLLTSDFKKDYKKAYSLIDGSSRWFGNNDIVELVSLYSLDNNNNLIPIKETKKNDIY